MKAHIILYVSDQEQATSFYSELFKVKPHLDVPGMTEIQISENLVLGLMPEKGIKSLLGEVLPDPSKGSGTPRAELYIRAQNADSLHQLAIKLGAKELSPLVSRNWGEKVAYSMDRDGHVLAFAKI